MSSFFSAEFSHWIPMKADTIPMMPENCPTSARKLSDMNRNGVRQKSEHCRQPPEYAIASRRMGIQVKIDQITLIGCNGAFRCA
jgi:hypothetical protein